MPWKQFIGLINCFRIAKVPRSQQGHYKSKIKIVLGEIEKFHKAQKKANQLKEYEFR
jgi:hypothetical protein